MFSFPAESGASQHMAQRNVDDNQNDPEVDTYMTAAEYAPASGYIECLLCDVRYSRVTGYDLHVTRYHIPSAEKKCTQCTAKFYSPTCYRRHRMGHITENLTESSASAHLAAQPAPTCTYMFKHS